MHIELLVEEPSAEAALQVLLPKILPAHVSFAVHPHQGKADLLGKLRDRLSGYRAWLPPDWRVVVLLDEDRQDCVLTKRQLEAYARQVGLLTKTASRDSFHVVNRLAIEELEAWFVGDVPALVAAYPKVPPTLGQRARFRDPDRIAGGTWEALSACFSRRATSLTAWPRLKQREPLRGT